MTKFQLLFIAMMTILFELSAQRFIQKERDFIIGPSVSQVRIQAFSTITPVGLQYEYMVLPGLSVEGSVAATNDYFEFDVSTIGHLIFFSLSKVERGGELLGPGWIGLLLSFGHTGFHFPITRGLEFVPYANLWRIRYYWEPEMNDSIYTFHSGSIGAKLKIKVSDNWSVAPFAEITQVYNSDRLQGWQAGVNFGYHYKKKKVGWPR